MIDDGGPAFPVIEQRDSLDQWVLQERSPGMTLRDYFAAQALAGAFRGGDTDIRDDIFARRCYEIADAMLKAREAQS